MITPLIEICVEGIDGLLAAQLGGADRAELCASLLEGGLTPSDGVVRQALSRATIPFHVIIRPRGGDFLYSDAEFATMLDDAKRLRTLGVAGIVIGCLMPDGTVDEARTTELAAAARPASVTFHRAFDVTADPHAALEALIRCGIDRVLTSGQRPTAIEGSPLLARLHAQAAGRIIVMGCGALGPETIGRVRRETGLTELHFSALAARPSGMRYRRPEIAMGAAGPAREYHIEVTDPDLVARTIRAAGRAAREG